ncbi:MAG: MFS transporter [Lachnospiraceae bacterium]
MNIFNFTKSERAWVLYDVGNSAFVLLVSTIIPIYYKSLTEAAGISDVNSTAFYSYALSISTIIVALLGPILGSIADNKGYKKPLFTMFMMLGVICCAALSIPTEWVLFLAIFILAKVGLSGSIIFYDAMLVDVTTDERMDVLSSNGYAWGYLGSCIPFIISVVIVLFGGDLFGISMGTGMMFAFILNAAWWFLVTLPLLRTYEQTHYVETVEHPVRSSLSRLGKIFKELKQDKKILFFLLAFFFYIDGVYTIIELATTYGSDVGITDTNLLLALLLTQFVAFPFALLFGRLCSKHEPKKLINVCICAYFLIAVYGIFLDTAFDFWVLAVCVGVFQGAIQALSRSYFAKLVPKEKAAEYFGIYDIFGKGASFMGTLLVGVCTQIFNTSRAGVASLSFLFIIGFIFFNMHNKIEAK